MNAQQETIYATTAEVLQIDVSELAPAIPWTDLEAERIDLVEIASTLEVEFQIDITGPDIDALKTVGDLVNLIAEKTQPSPASA